MRTSKYSDIFKLVLESKEGLTIELTRADLALLKPNLSRLKQKFNEDNQIASSMLGETPQLIKGNITYEVHEDEKPEYEGNVIVTIKIVEPTEFKFTIISRG